jgi:succinate dehydrogenase/fumarate reductase flavoprotein subunit
MASSVPGLFIAGGLGGHSNGLIALVTYDGKVAAESVASYVQTARRSSAVQEQIAREEQRLQTLLRVKGADGIAPVRVKKAIRELMWTHMGVEKNAGSMNEALDKLERIRVEMLPRLAVKSASRRSNHEWLDAIDVHNMLDVCVLMVHSALNRKESRGPFIRTDYPEMDNEHWLVQNILVPRTGGEFSFRTEPYDLPYFRPDFMQKDNLAVHW